MKAKKLTAILLSVILLMSIIPFAAFAGDGTAPRWTDEGNYDISWFDSTLKTFELDTAAELAGLSYLANESNINFFRKTVTLTANIDLSAYEWRPISDGSVFNYFKGTFNGNGHKITGLKIEDHSYTYTGLFGAILNGKVQNLTVNCNITGNNDYTAAIVGYAMSGTISNVKALGTINAHNNVAGIAGYNAGTIINACNNANINGYSYLAGIASTNDGIIVNSYNLGSISGQDTVAGIVAYNNGVIANVYSGGTITTESTSGGIAGMNTETGTFENCYWYGLSCPDGINYDPNNNSTNITSFGGSSVDQSLEETVEGIKNLTEALNLWVENNAATYAGLSVWRSAGTTAENLGFPLFFSGYWTDPGHYDTSWYVGNEHKKEYTITTAEQLAGLAALSNTEGSVVSFKNKKIFLANDIDLSEYDWVPIADSDMIGIFKGTFEGNYKRITGMNINTTGDGAGLFGYTDTMAVVKDINIVGNIQTVNSFCGGIAGYNCGTIENCTIDGNVIGECSIGGVVGINTGTINNCIIYGSVSSYSIAGGVVGANYGNVYNCSANGDIKASYNVGGIAGMNKQGRIINCSGVGSMYNTVETVGGIVGHNMENAMIVNCYVVPLTPLGGKVNIGAITGINDGELINCYWKGNDEIEPAAGQDNGALDHCTSFTGTCGDIATSSEQYGMTSLVEIFNAAIDSFEEKGLYYWRDATSETEKHGYPVLTMPRVISGIPTITGNAIYGETLTADYSNIIPPEALSSATFQWQRSYGDSEDYINIPHAIEGSYTLTTEDIGCYIRVVITAFGDYIGSTASNSTGPVILATPVYEIPSGLTAYVGETLANVSVPNAENGAFFWESPVTSSVGGEGETAATMSFVPDDRGFETINGIPVIITVSKNVAKNAPEPTRLAEKTYYSLLVECITGQEYSIDGGATWQQNGYFKNLEPLTTYEIKTRKLFDSETEEESMSASIYLTTLRAPVHASAADNSFSLGGSIFTQNEVVYLTAHGAGMDGTAPSLGDTRWQPIGANVENKGETVLTAPTFATTFDATSTGSYIMNVVFQEYVYTTNGWEFTGNIDTKSQEFTVNEPVVLQEVGGWVETMQASFPDSIEDIATAARGIAQFIANFFNKLFSLITGSSSIVGQLFKIK